MKSGTDLPKAQAPRARGRKVVRRILLVAGPLVLIVAGVVAYLRGGRYVATDNAFVHAGMVTVTSEISGAVVEVAVKDNQRVGVGEMLFRLDESPYRIALQAARAQRDVVRHELASLRSSYDEKIAAIAEAREQVEFARNEFQRQQTLARQNVSSIADLDAGQHAFDAARQHLAVLERQAASVVATLGGDVTTPPEQHPRILAAQAAVDRAERDLRLTTVVAPQDGIVTRVQNLPVGRYLASGQPAFSLVAIDHAWIEANLKETELTHVKAGDPVVVEIDTYPGKIWKGTVSTISPATGAEFALIPPQNATGNWVKTVQRIPVRVDLATPAGAPVLRAGMSAEVEIDTGHQRSLRDISRSIAGWFGDGPRA